MFFVELFSDFENSKPCYQGRRILCLKKLMDMATAQSATSQSPLLSCKLDLKSIAQPGHLVSYIQALYWGEVKISL